MRFFDGFLLSTILLLFPLFLYLIYVIYKKIINKEKIDITFSIALILSLILMIRYGYCKDNYYISILMNIPLLFAYLKNKKILILVISVILGVYFILVFKIDIYVVMFEYLSYYLLHIVSYKRTFSTYYIINNFTIIKTGILSFIIFAFESPNVSAGVNILLIILTIIVFYSASLFYYKLIQKIEDIVLLNNTMKELEKEKSIRNSLFKIIHEIKNPIAVCKGYLDMIDLNNKKKIEKYAPIIKSEINRTLTLLDDYLDFSRVKIQKDIIDIIMLLEETVRSMGVLLKEKDIIFNANISEEEIYMMADYNRLKQVFVNIIKNSMESRMENSNLQIDITTITSDNNIKIIIKDNGIGMTKEELNKLGEAFYTTKANGTGIGVNLSKEIIEKHNGTLIYESQKFVGTSVIISLPIDKELNCY